MVAPKEIRFSPSLCVTHDCNLECRYCYQKHSSGMKMTFDIAKNSIDWIFNNVPKGMHDIEISFIGGEPLLEFDLMKDVVEYVKTNYENKKYIFFASTNGTVLNNEMKTWFTKNKDIIYLGLSLDGTKTTHDYNRSNSFDLIDMDYFKTTWPIQAVKMTLSDYSLYHLAEDIKFIHGFGFNISGVNLFEGNFDWGKEEYIKVLIPQLYELVDYYVENKKSPLNQMFDKQLHLCEAKIKNKKWCGIGNGTNFFDVDGKMYPCSFVTPMTFPEEDVIEMLKTDFTDENNFLDIQCFEKCYIYPICPTCAGSNYMVNRHFAIRNKGKCRIQKLIALFIADLNAKRIRKNKDIFDKETLFYTIEAIKKIRQYYLYEFNEYLI
jgi:sulfatase maturation enzyme AslB (radical SAM superfamily)